METMYYDRLAVQAYESNQALGAAAAADLAEILRAEVNARMAAAIIVATGNSQLSFMEALAATADIPWERITVFHMDEYLGMKESHPASFRRYLHEKLVDVVHPHAFYGLVGDAADVPAEMKRYATALKEHQPVACVMGIGENGHLAFNDPPASFDTPEAIHVVALAQTARQQQVGEGHFAALAEVPTHAVTLTIPALLAPAYLLVVVPEARKAAAVKAALEGPVTPDCPASILRTCAHAKLYLDPESAALLAPHG